MPEFPNVPFTDGDAFTAEHAYKAFYSPVFDGNTALLGHRAPLADIELDPNGIRKDVAAIQNGLKPTVVSGLTVNVATGVVGYVNGLTTVPSTNIVVADNATSFIWYEPVSSTIQTGLVTPVVRLLIAQVVTSGGAITSLTDIRFVGYPKVTPRVDSILTFGGQSSIDKIVTQGEVLGEGVIYCRNFIVNAGITCTVSNPIVIHCSGKAVIDGTINCSTFAKGAIGFATGRFPIVQPSRPGVGAGTFGTTVGWGTQLFGSGGRTGVAQNFADLNLPSTNVQGAGGDGGGSISIRAAQGIEVRGSISAKGGDAVHCQIFDNSSSFNTTNPLNLAGAGGGSGGGIQLSSPSGVQIFNTAILDVRGGEGGNAASSLPFATYPAVVRGWGGGGGGGGWVVILCPQDKLVIATSNILLTGGLSGLAVGTASLSSTVGAGAAGVGGAQHTINTDPRTVGGSGSLVTLPYLPLG